MLKLGVLNLTLKSPPDPKRSVTEPRFLEGAGAATGAGSRGAGARGAGAGARGAGAIGTRTGAGAGAGAGTSLTEFLLLPDTAEDTVCETRGLIWATIWETILSVLGVRTGAGARTGAEARTGAGTRTGAGAGTGRDIGRVEAPETAVETV